MLEYYGLVFLAALAAGGVNALAGGGTLISFPALTALGVPPVVANMTNTVALCPGYFGGAFAQRRDLMGQERRVAVLVAMGLVGGALGALALNAVPESLFRRLVPWLIALAAALLAAQPRVRRWLARPQREGRAARGRGLGLVAVGLASAYGGFFGAGLGVVLLGLLGLIEDQPLGRLNAIKQAVSLAANVAAAAYFAASGRVVWPVAAVMASGAWIGGALGGTLAGRLASDRLRQVVVALGALVAAFYWAS